MRVEIFTLCDAATLDAAGKLNILVSFDRLNAREEPVVHPQCTLAIKLRFERIEEGQKQIRIAFVDQDGASVMPNVEATTQVQCQDNDPSTRGFDSALCKAARVIRGKPNRVAIQKLLGVLPARIVRWILRNSANIV